MQLAARAARLVLVLLALPVGPILGGAAENLADRENSPGSAEVARLRLDNARLEREIAQLAAAGRGGSAATADIGLRAEQALLHGLAALDPAMRSAAVQALLDASQPLKDGLQEEVARLARQNQETASAWATIAADAERWQREGIPGPSTPRKSSVLDSLLGPDQRWFWLSGGLALGLLLAVVLHERRHEIRRGIYGSHVGALGFFWLLSLAVVLLFGLAVATFLIEAKSSETPKASPLNLNLVAQEVPGESEVAGLPALRDSAETLKRQYDAAAAGWQAALTGGDPDLARLAIRLQQLRAGLQQILLEAQLRDALAAGIQEQTRRFDQFREQWTVQRQLYRRGLRWTGLIRALTGVALIGAVALGAVFFYRGLRRRQQVVAETCPFCLGRGHLVPVESLSANPGYAYGGPPPVGPQADEPSSDGLAMVRCRNVLSRQPYEECEYRFADAYRPLTKLCLPTLGVPQAGKTHWLAMVYWLLNRGNYPRAVQFEKIRSQSSSDFDLIVEEILTSRLGTAATQRERIPHPLVFNFRDHDLWGRSNLLVNIFDYSGEVTSDMGVEDFRRRRALAADGFLFFLDPTYPSEPQAKALAEFREDLRLVTGVRARGRIRTPMALCVSKIDLLGRQGLSPEDGLDAVQRFYNELKRIDPSGEALDLPVMRARSRLIACLREAIWPGWQIERQVRDLFGSRYLFFPLTPVGLEGRGETDLSLRTISPFGLMEPLVWLLHMNGYRIV